MFGQFSNADQSRASRAGLPSVLALLLLQALLLAGCSFSKTPSTLTADPKASSAKETVPRLIKREFGVVWSNPESFGAVPKELQASGDQACTAAAGGTPMIAVGYHAQAIRLDGSLFPRGGFLCAALEVPQTASIAPTSSLPQEVQSAAPATQQAQLPDLSARIDGWAKAWAAKDVDGYFEFYASSFRPKGFANLAAWKTSRQSRINGAGAITIDISDVSSKLLADGAIETRFTQRYASARLKQTSRKTLVWALDGGRWRIVSETTEP